MGEGMEREGKGSGLDSGELGGLAFVDSDGAGETVELVGPAPRPLTTHNHRGCLIGQKEVLR